MNNNSNNSYNTTSEAHERNLHQQPPPPPFSSAPPTEPAAHERNLHQQPPQPFSSAPPPAAATTMNNNSTTTTTAEAQSHLHQHPPPPSASQPPAAEAANTTMNNNSNTTEAQTNLHQQPPSAEAAAAALAAKASNNENVAAEKFGTHIMGAPAAPSSHPNNQKAALWSAEDHHPYVQHAPIEKQTINPMETVVHVFNSWSHKAESLARNIWQNLNTGSSVCEDAWGKVGLTAKALTGGGFESLYKQTFVTHPNEKLRRTFACYLSTSTGPVAGTLYLSNFHVAFCSDRPLCFTAPSGQEAWSYYKVMIPLGKLSVMNPVSMKENPSERYIQITTVDGHDFWFMGFVNYEKASKHLSQSMSEFVAHQLETQQVR